MPDLRQAFFDEMSELTTKDSSIRILVGDLGYSFMEEYQRRFPKNFINMGIAEQNMIGVAAGMALGGLKPYVYSGVIFAIMRPYEQLRDDVCYNNLPVKIIGTGASGFLGPTHNLGEKENEEDLLKNLPNLKRLYLKESSELPKALIADGPVFIRL